jgi:hypothetical protein
MDLHAWITQQVDRAETTARDAGGSAWHWEHSIGDMCNDPTCPYGELATEDTVLMQVHGYDVTEPWQGAAHIELNDPAAILRRCEADRRILARHRLDPDAASTPRAAACDGCGYEWVQDYCDPVTDNLNDCPELLDLAHAHGITDEILAGLDRPQTPEQPKREPHPEGFAGMLRDAFTAALTVPITTSDVPAALRGPRWKP